MGAQFSFARREIKYLLTRDSMETMMKRLEPFMQVDDYGEYTIKNIYYDTPDFSMIKRSLDKPVYKEKFRVRAYEGENCDRDFFAEIKKKYEGIVYKRRIVGDFDSIDSFVNAACANEVSTQSFDESLPATFREATNTQIRREIEELLKQYRPVPKAMIAYERLALYGKSDGELRLTFDKNIRGRCDKLDIRETSFGESITDFIVMEVKVLNSIPLWLCDILSDEKLKKGSFSKYGTFFLNNIWGDYKNA